MVYRLLVGAGLFLGGSVIAIVLIRFMALIDTLPAK